MIKSAAIRIKGTDKIYTGSEHYNILNKRDENCKLIITDIDNIEYGFVTDDNKFVDREEAGKIAYECGQTKEKIYRLQSKDILKGE
jgi:hypothetical protein